MLLRNCAAFLNRKESVGKGPSNIDLAESSSLRMEGNVIVKFACTRRRAMSTDTGTPPSMRAGCPECPRACRKSGTPKRTKKRH